ncbi:hypothetical protein [Kordia sp.]|uniref:hypothetical protein n=1 Tax=Kordia sp. TaxID=1965332 RepID=UPI003D285CA4
MRKVFMLIVTTIFITATYTSCTPEVLTDEEETEILTVDPYDDGTTDEEDHRETGD